MTTQQHDLAALLSWYVDNGVDEAVGEEPINRFAATPGDSVAPAAPSRPAPTPKSPPPASQAVASAKELAAATTTFESLVASIESFDGCALKRTATTTCIFDGNPEADIMLIGEAPGAQEDRQGKPFVGPAGQLLDKMLAAIGLDRTKVLITNLLFWRPPGNRTPTADEVAACLPFVERMVEIVDPKLLVYVGGSAAKAMLDRSEGITRLRGRWFIYETAEGKQIPATAIFHPAFLLRQPARKRETWRDLLAIRQKLETYT